MPFNSCVVIFWLNHCVAAEAALLLKSILFMFFTFHMDEE